MAVDTDSPDYLESTEMIEELKDIWSFLLLAWVFGIGMIVFAKVPEGSYHYKLGCKSGVDVLKYWFGKLWNRAF